MPEHVHPAATAAARWSAAVTAAGATMAAGAPMASGCTMSGRSGAAVPASRLSAIAVPPSSAAARREILENIYSPWFCGDTPSLAHHLPRFAPARPGWEFLDVLGRRTPTRWQAGHG